MTVTEYQTELAKYRIYLKPEVFQTLIDTADIFSEKSRKTIVDNLIKADSQMRKLAVYEEKREGILARGMQTIENIYQKAVSSFDKRAVADKTADKESAEKLITNF